MMENKAVYFISDLHLHLEDREKELQKEKLLEKLFEQITIDGSDLYIIGDLFDYWFEYEKVVQKDSYRVLYLFYKLATSGVKIHYIIGNHDFYHYDLFEKEFNAKLYEDNVTTYINGKKLFLSHGDGMIPNDTGYKVLKFFLRNKIIQKIASYIHPDFLLKLAIASSKASRKYTNQKNYGEIDGLLLLAENKIINENYDFVIMGHSHSFEYKQIQKGVYVNLGSWINQPLYAKFHNNSIETIILK